jgi:hypothetical protein
MLPERFREPTDQPDSPREDVSAMTPGGFMAWPLPAGLGTPAAAWGWQQNLYQIAFEHARAAQRPSLLERSLARVWN